MIGAAPPPRQSTFFENSAVADRRIARRQLKQALLEGDPVAARQHFQRLHIAIQMSKTAVDNPHNHNKNSHRRTA